MAAGLRWPLCFGGRCVLVAAILVIALIFWWPLQILVTDIATLDFGRRCSLVTALTFCWALHFGNRSGRNVSSERYTLVAASILVVAVIWWPLWFSSRGVLVTSLIFDKRLTFSDRRR